MWGYNPQNWDKEEKSIKSVGFNFSLLISYLKQLLKKSIIIHETWIVY